jgi:hypothetical protein
LTESKTYTKPTKVLPACTIRGIARIKFCHANDAIVEMVSIKERDIRQQSNALFLHKEVRKCLDGMETVGFSCNVLFSEPRRDGIIAMLLLSKGALL